MLDSVVPWLDQVSSQVFWTCALALVAIDLVAVAAVMQTRSRALVNRWTGPVLAANLLLLGAGLGVPVAAFAAKAVANAVAPSIAASATATAKDAQPEAPPAPTAP
ncbi:MAG TPA: hypothetical protein PLI70_03760 [Gemmatimonadales bacterium]|nr:hypothetical protein [Gemmatimonadales bacterium]HRZ08957.1 hypothetical protein [Gemmatimonadales bacterium]